jgi:hypothetical protein
MASRTLAGDAREQARLEETLLGVLSIGRRCDYGQMAALMHTMADPADVARAASRFATSPEAMPRLYAAALLTGDYGRVEGYLSGLSDEDGMNALRGTLPLGRGALDKLFDEGKGLYSPPRPLAWLDKVLDWMRPTPVLDFALKSPGAALAMKNILLFASGYALALALSRLFSLFCADSGWDCRKRRRLLATANGFFAFFFTILIWLIAEPNLLRFSTEKLTQPTWQLNLTTNALSTSNTMNPNSLDQASVLSLLLFAFLQLAVYILCVMRVNKIKASKDPAPMRLKLLENEEYFFDLGLYVGLGGTVGSLVMLAMGIVQASLVAAYASTFFGIIFSAILKIVHIRALRRALIIESNAAQPNTPAKGA